MWIRSQDKIRLLNIDLFFIDGKEIKYYLPNTNTFYVIGKYKSQARALEVLDEIQKHIIGHLLISNSQQNTFLEDAMLFPQSYDKITVLPTVYELPKE